MTDRPRSQVPAGRREGQRTITSRKELLAAYDAGMTEKQWQAQVVKEAKALGWLVFFTWRSLHSPAGEPDLRLVRDRVLWCELKTEKGKVSPLQQDAMERLRAAGAEVHLWRPSDYDTALEVLK